MFSCSINIAPQNVINHCLNYSHQCVIAHVLTQCVSSHVLSGLCKISGYEILRHGTSWSNYKSIIRMGADPKKGGTTTEGSSSKYHIESSYAYLSDGTLEATDMKIPRNSRESAPIVQRARNHFYVFRDSKLGIEENGNRQVSFLITRIIKRVGSIFHSYLAYIADYQANTQEEDLSQWMKVAATIKAIFTPKLKFIYTLDEVEGPSKKDGVFEKDPDYDEESAYRTTQTLSNNRIGMMGLIAHLDKKHVWKHVKSNPGRVIQGVIQLSLGIIFTSTGLGLVT